MGQTKKRRGKREANGRLSRKPSEVAARSNDAHDTQERETMSVALEARQRIHITDEWMRAFIGDKRMPRESLARDQKAGTAIGRYCLQGQITQTQYDAAIMFQESGVRYRRAIDAPPGPGAVDLNRTHGIAVTTENPGQLRKWRQQHEAALRAIGEKQREVGMRGNLLGALDTILNRDVMLEHLLGDMRLALNALAKHYRLEGARAAA